MSRSELYSTYSVEPAMVVAFKPNRMLDTDSVDRVADSLKDLLARADEDAFVFDFSGVGYLSSRALGLLLGIHRDLARDGRGLKLAGLSDENREVFRVTKLDAVFDIYADATAAIKAFQTRE